MTTNPESHTKTDTNSHANADAHTTFYYSITADQPTACFSEEKTIGPINIGNPNEFTVKDRRALVVPGSGALEQMDRSRETETERVRERESEQ